ncbi:MAG: hypothetical protein JWO67_2864 [Streptosporangiaceae bacterium]|jgi:hypothetical protein|nr:hypothetical protein [Streptosporangiaceae bacterium]
MTRGRPGRLGTVEDTAAFTVLFERTLPCANFPCPIAVTPITLRR